MNNVIRLVRGQRTKCEVCQHPAIIFISTGGGGQLSDGVPVFAEIHASVIAHSHICSSGHVLLIHEQV